MYKNKLLENTYKNLGLDFVIDDVKHLYIYNFYISEFQFQYINTYSMQLNDGINKDTGRIKNKNYQIDENDENSDNATNEKTPSKYNPKHVSIYKGLKRYGYSDVYEILLWYNYYKYQNRHILQYDYLGKTNGPVNTSYFSRIPHHYRNLDSKKGLHMIKQILDKIIVENNGMPGYYDPRILRILFYVK